MANYQEIQEKQAAEKGAALVRYKDCLDSLLGLYELRKLLEKGRPLAQGGSLVESLGKTIHWCYLQEQATIKALAQNCEITAPANPSNKQADSD